MGVKCHALVIRRVLPILPIVERLESVMDELKGVTLFAIAAWVSDVLWSGQEKSDIKVVAT